MSDKSTKERKNRVNPDKAFQEASELMQSIYDNPLWKEVDFHELLEHINATSLTFIRDGGEDKAMESILEFYKNLKGLIASVTFENATILCDENSAEGTEIIERAHCLLEKTEDETIGELHAVIMLCEQEMERISQIPKRVAV